MSFLSHKDRHDLFEHIKKINPNLEMADKVSQALLNKMEEKLAETHADIWKKMITIVIFGGEDIHKSAIQSRIMSSHFTGFKIVEVNKHFIRLVREHI